MLQLPLSGPEAIRPGLRNAADNFIHDIHVGSSYYMADVNIDLESLLVASAPSNLDLLPDSRAIAAEVGAIQLDDSSSGIRSPSRAAPGGRTGSENDGADTRVVQTSTSVGVSELAMLTLTAMVIMVAGSMKAPRMELL
jgi:hypothetical protein